MLTSHQENSPIYPLTSKLPAFKRFRASLSELIERLVLAAAELGSLYTTDLITTLQTWVIAMSSSQIRSFRHTATVVALEVETALCQVAAAVDKEAEIVGRQREGERKRKAVNKSTAVREKDLDGKSAEVRKRRTILAEYLKEIVNGCAPFPSLLLSPFIPLPVSLSTDIATWITTFALNVSKPWVHGLPTIPPISSTDPISGMLAGSSPIPAPPSASKQYEHSRLFMRNPSTWAHSLSLPNASNPGYSRWLVVIPN